MNDKDEIFFASFPMEYKVSMLIKHIHLYFEKSLNNLMAVNNLTASQANVMGYINYHSDREVNPIDIERGLKLSGPTVTGILQRLAAKGLIYFDKSEKDGRYKQIKFTDEGRNCLKAADDELKRMNGILCRGFSEDRLREIYNELGVMLENLNESGVELC